MRWGRHQLVISGATALFSLVGARHAAAQGAAHGAAHPAASAASAGGAKIEKPKIRAVTGAHCVLASDGTLGGVFPNDQVHTLAFTVGPGSAMADQLHASKAPYKGPGAYKNVIIAVYLGKSALTDSYIGLGTVTVNPDRRTGAFALNDGSASGTWDCGAALR